MRCDRTTLTSRLPNDSHEYSAKLMDFSLSFYSILSFYRWWKLRWRGGERSYYRNQMGQDRVNDGRLLAIWIDPPIAGVTV